MSIIVEILVGAGLVLGPFALFRRKAGLPFGECLAAGCIASFLLWNILGLLGDVICYIATTSSSWSGDVVSIKAEPSEAAVMVRVRTSGGQLQSLRTSNLQVKEAAEGGGVAEITSEVTRRPTWWPQVLSMGPAFMAVGEPTVVIKAPQRELKEILKGL